MSSSPAVVLLGTHLTVDDIDAVAQRTATAVIPTDRRCAIDECFAFARQLAEAEAPVYGLSTGCGPLAEHRISAAQRVQFQRNLIRSHANSLGPPHPTAFVRAAMAVRAHVLAQGHSGIDPRLLDTVAGMLNAGIHPIVRAVGGVGASGDLVELAQIALAVVGEGAVEVGGRPQPAAEALRAAQVMPLTPSFREGLALINGTSFHTGTAAVLIVRAERALTAAQVIAAMGFEALLGDVQALAAALHRARPHAGQESVARNLSTVVRGSGLLQRDSSPAHRQDPYSLRCIAQILGPLLTVVSRVRADVETEINSISDNPIFFAAEKRVLHGGNFHGQPLALALDQLKTALVEAGVQSERRTARLLDVSLNRGLPAFLVHDTAGLNSGFMGLQYCATAMAAENLVLAAPASVHSLPTNANNQDIVSMGMVAARQAAQVLDNVVRMLAIELLCAAQALELRGVTQAGHGTRLAHGLVRQSVDYLSTDRPLAEDVERIVALIESGRLGTALQADQADVD